MTTKTESEAILRRTLSDYAVAHGLDAGGTVAHCKKIGARRAAATTDALVAADAALACQTYDACFGPGAFATDARSR